MHCVVLEVLLESAVLFYQIFQETCFALLEFYHYFVDFLDESSDPRIGWHYLLDFFELESFHFSIFDDNQREKTHQKCILSDSKGTLSYSPTTPYTLNRHSLVFRVTLMPSMPLTLVSFWSYLYKYLLSKSIKMSSALVLSNLEWLPSP